MNKFSCFVDVEKIKTITVKKFLLDKVQSENLTNRQYKDMKSLLNMMLDYCVELEYTSHNVARNVRNVSYKKFAEKKNGLDLEISGGNFLDASGLELSLFASWYTNVIPLSLDVGRKNNKSSCINGFHELL